MLLKYPKYRLRTNTKTEIIVKSIQNLLRGTKVIYFKGYINFFNI